MGTVRAGTWLSPYPDKQHEIADVVDELGVTEMSSSFIGAPGTIGGDRELVTRAWNLHGKEDAYRDFIATVAESMPATAPEVRREQIALVHAWRGLLSLVPCLPAELLPARWGSPVASLADIASNP
jgi:phenylacetic acid degradation operon negative regulatory protein